MNAVAPGASDVVQGPRGDGGVMNTVDCCMVGTQQSHLLLDYKGFSIVFYS